MAANARTARKTAATRQPRTPRELAPASREAEAYDQDSEASAADAQELEATGRHVTVSLCGEPVRVVPAGAWPVSAQRRLRAGDFDGFMAAVLHEDDYQLYEDIDPTFDEMGQFVEDAGEVSGESQGKSRGPAASSRTTRRR